MTTGLRHRAALVAAAVVLAGCAAPVGADGSAAEPARAARAQATSAPNGDAAGAEHPPGWGDATASARVNGSGGTEQAAAGRAEAAAGSVPGPRSRDAAADLEPVRRFRSVRGHAETPLPTRVRVPAIGVDSTLLHLGREPDGTVEVPADWQRAGWFTEAARPGQPGPAVVLGHVDSRAGPAVFYRLHELQPGDEILLERADGSTVQFTVDRVERHGKDDFPTEAVYYPTLEPALRLVTCGGAFDPRERSYRDNVIVFATQAS